MPRYFFIDAARSKSQPAGSGVYGILPLSRLGPPLQQPVPADFAIGQDSNILLACSAQTISVLTNYVSNTDLTNTLDDYSVTSHTHQIDNITDIIITSPVAGELLVYSGGTWINSAVTGIDISNYYTKTQLDGGQLD